MHRIGLILAICALVAIVGPATAKVKNFNCKEDSCNFTESLKKGETLWFTATCGGKSPDIQRCTTNNKNVSCTGGAACSGLSDTCSCACTNWDITKKHSGTVKIQC
jgi:hypothetical protein